VRYSVGLFVFALMFSVGKPEPPRRNTSSSSRCLPARVWECCPWRRFFFLIDYAGRLLRPGSILATVGRKGLDVIEVVYPEMVGAGGDEVTALTPLPETPRRVVTNGGFSQVVLAVDLRALMVLARRTRGIIEFVPQVGDFLSVGEPLFILYGGATAISDRALNTTVALGPERTMEQDPLFAVRILVDIALKALSPAINDPTTGVLALDQIHRLLRAVGKRRLHGRRTDRRTRAGTRRVSHAGLGRFRPPGVYRNPGERRRPCADRAAHARAHR
jgi:uncharacterized membrane protein